MVVIEDPMLNKKEKQVVVECTKNLYKLVAKAYMSSKYEEADNLVKITDRLESLISND